MTGFGYNILGFGSGVSGGATFNVSYLVIAGGGAGGHGSGGGGGGAGGYRTNHTSAGGVSTPKIFEY